MSPESLPCGPIPLHFHDGANAAAVLYAASTVVAAARNCSTVLANIGQSQLEDTLHKVLHALERASSQIPTAELCHSILSRLEKTTGGAELSERPIPNPTSRPKSRTGLAALPPTSGDIFGDSLFEEAGLPNLMDVEWDSWDSWMGLHLDIDL